MGSDTDTDAEVRPVARSVWVGNGAGGVGGAGGVELSVYMGKP